MKSLFRYCSKSNLANLILYIDFVTFDESINFQIKYSLIFARTIDNQTSQFFENFNLISRFVFDIVLNVQTLLK